MGNFKEDIARTEAFIFDVDGVMTDGGIIPTLDGDFIRRYNAKDGYALGYAMMGLSGAVAVLALGFFLVGIAKGSVINTCTILVSDNSADRTRGMNTMHA